MIRVFKQAPAFVVEVKYKLIIFADTELLKLMSTSKRFCVFESRQCKRKMRKQENAATQQKQNEKMYRLLQPILGQAHEDFWHKHLDTKYKLIDHMTGI